MKMNLQIVIKVLVANKCGVFSSVYSDQVPNNRKQ